MPRKQHRAEPTPKAPSPPRQPQPQEKSLPQVRHPDRLLLHTDLADLQRQVGNHAVQRLLHTPAQVGAPQTLVLQRALFLKSGRMLDPHDDTTPAHYSTADIVAFANWLQYASDPSILGRVARGLESIRDPDSSEVVAKSVIKFLETRANRRPDSNNPLGKILKDKWWKLFIDKKLHQHEDDLSNAMSFDVDASPGYFRAMMNAFEEHLEGIDPAAGIRPLTADDVIGAHAQVTRGTLKRDEQKFIPMPQGLSGRNPRSSSPEDEGAVNTSYGVTKDDEAVPSLSGFQEMVDSGVMGMREDAAHLLAQGLTSPDDPRAQFKFKAATMTVASGKKGFNSRLSPLGRFVASTDYKSQDVRDKITAFLATYYDSMRGIAARDYRNPEDRQRHQLRTIVTLIRALHVSHFFQDANGRLNTMLLLNKFLLENDFSPVIMDDTAVFGGELSVDQLVGQVVRGMNTFNAEIEEFPVEINVDRNYTFFRFFVDHRPHDSRAGILYVVEFDLNRVPKGRAQAIQNLLKAAMTDRSCFQTGWRGAMIYKLGFTKPEPAERLERASEAFA